MVPPEYRPPAARSIVESEVLDTKKIGIQRRVLEVVSAITIFVITLLCIVMRLFISKDNPAIINNPGDGYLVTWYPFFMQLILFVVSIFFFVRAWFFKSCSYTKIISTSFLIAKLLSLIYVVHPFKISWNVYAGIWDSVVYIGVMGACMWWLLSYLHNKYFK